ncbi:MAG: aminotransferase class I/II-fold pyridoxal phosphate-dependent enzyme [Polyangiales bacterium]
MNERIYLSPPDMSARERQRLLEAFDSNWIAPLGPEVDAFERELSVVTGTVAAAALSSGTAGLHLALMLSGVKAGEEVWLPTLTFAATANAAVYVGANVAFIDVDRHTWSLDVQRLRDAFASRAKHGRLPKALITVDLYGQCCDYDAVEALCEEYGVVLIEDAAEALGASYRGRAAGSFGRFGVLSFNGNKIITTSGGGALLTHDSSDAVRARFLASQAKENTSHYEHKEIGYNYRLSNLLAAIGRGQLQRLPELVEARRKNREFYKKFLEKSGFEFMREADGCHSTFWLSTATVDPSVAGVNAKAIIAELERHNIEARRVWKPMHRQPVFSHCEVFGGEIAESLFERGLCLPSGSSLNEEARARVLGAIANTPGFRFASSVSSL